MKKYHKHFKAAQATHPTGFFRQMTRHTAVFYKRSSKRLVVSFDNMKSRDAASPLFPWGYSYLKNMGVSQLGIMMSRRNDWFRHSDLQVFFDELRDTGFFEGFEEVIFYGSSMGGYGALAYASAAPGCRVVVLTPQTHLDPAVVPFENRFNRGYERGRWEGTYLDGATGARAASAVYVFYDPYHDMDAAHVARLDAKNLVPIRMNWTGHQTTRILNKMGLLGPMIQGAFDGTLTIAGARRLVRECERSKLGVRQMLNEALNRGHAGLVLRVLDSQKTNKSNLKFPKVKEKARQLENV